MNIEEKLSAIKAINEAKEKVENQLSSLENLKPTAIYSIIIKRFEIDISSEDISETIWQNLRDMLADQKDELIEKAKKLMK